MSADKLIGGPDRARRPNIQRARVTSVDPGAVRVKALNSGHTYVVPDGNWIGTPATGNACLVLIDDNGDDWAICPSATP